MDYKIFNFNLDLGRESRNAIKPVQGESAVKLRPTLTHNSQPFNLTDCDVRCLFRKPDMTYSYIDGVIIDAAKGIVEIALTNQVLLLSGSVVGLIEVTGAIGIARTWLFTMDVQPGMPLTDVISMDEFPAVEQMLIDVADIKANFNAVVAGVTVDGEVILARGVFTTLQERLDAKEAEFSAQLGEIADIKVDKAEYNKTETTTMTPDLLLQKARMAKGGSIGTNGKGVIAIRFDDWTDAFRTNIYPLLLARAIPASIALISRFNTVQPWGANTSWDDIRNFNKNGIEMWSHGIDHLDPTPHGYAGLVEQIVTSKAEIEAQNIKVLGWAQPGATPQTAELPYDGFAQAQSFPDAFDSDTGRLIYSTYALSEAYMGGAVRPLPALRYHGMDHITVDTAQLVHLKAQVDSVVNYKYGIEFMCHAGVLGQSIGYLTLAEFTELLDYIKLKRDNGEIEILTPSGLNFADTSHKTRMELVANGNFDGITVENPKSWNYSYPTGNMGITFPDGVGRDGSRALAISETASNIFVSQAISYLKTRGVSGEQFEFSCWIKASGATTPTFRVIIQDAQDSTRLNIQKSEPVSPATGWKLYRFCFGIPKNTDTLLIRLARQSGGPLIIDDASIKIL